MRSTIFDYGIVACRDAIITRLAARTIVVESMIKTYYLLLSFILVVNPTPLGVEEGDGCVVIEEICHDSYYIYRSLECLSVMLRYSGLFGLVCNSPVQPWAGCNKIVVFMMDPRGYI